MLSLETVGQKSQSQAQGKEREDTHMISDTGGSWDYCQYLLHRCRDKERWHARTSRLASAWPARYDHDPDAVRFLGLLTVGAQGTQDTCGLRVCCSH